MGLHGLAQQELMHANAVQDPGTCAGVAGRRSLLGHRRWTVAVALVGNGRVNNVAFDRSPPTDDGQWSGIVAEAQDQILLRGVQAQITTGKRWGYAWEEWDKGQA